MGRRRKIKSVKELEKLWKDYKIACNNRSVLSHDFSSKNSEFVSATLKKCVSYTIEGFCVFVGISRASFYEYYADNDVFADTVTLIREECEVDAREKFELSIIPSQLSGLWMSKYGYTNRTDTTVDGVTSVQILDNIPRGDDNG